MDPNLKVPLSTITNTFNRYAKRATTNTEKHYLFEITEAVGTAIGQQHSGVTVEDFILACGVNPEWGKVAA